MTGLVLDAAWRARLAARVDQPPLAPRVPLLWRDVPIGSVERGFAQKLEGNLPLYRDGEAWRVEGDLTASLQSIADAMRVRGLAHAWRDEQLAVRSPGGQVLGTIERAAVRPLGIATHAVHLVGFAPDGRHWVQQRSFDKANDPGLWDTLMGGMVPARDTLDDALERETWEEAGLRRHQLRDIAHGGRVRMCRPAGMAHGYVVEWIDWFRCVVPEGVAPENQDGEVHQFRLLAPAAVSDMLLRDDFTLEAAAVMTESAP